MNGFHPLPLHRRVDWARQTCAIMQAGEVSLGALAARAGYSKAFVCRCMSKPEARGFSNVVAMRITDALFGELLAEAWA